MEPRPGSHLDRYVGLAVVEALEAWDKFCVDVDSFPDLEEAMNSLRNEVARLVTIELGDD